MAETEHPTILAVDFDGTLVSPAFPEIGDPDLGMIKTIAGLREHGCKVILWTCRVDDLLDSAVKFCRDLGLEFDAVNDNLPEMIEAFGKNPRKIYADLYIDDRSLSWDKDCATGALQTALEKAERRGR